MRYLKKFNLLSPQQFGFRQGYSTELALITLTEEIKQAIDRGLLVGSVFIDLTKAFDTINHHVLLAKLESFGMSGPPLSFIKSYLSNRSQMVHVNGHLSTPKLINVGVPQGSILGPLLFLMFINDLPTILTRTKCILYADDTTIFQSSKSVSSLQSDLNTDLHNITLWCQANYLQINATKTVFMLFHSPRISLDIQPSLHIGNTVINISSEARFLGVILDSELKFHKHAASLVKKIAFGIHVIIKTRTYFPPHIIRTLYFAYIHSHISYCVSSWANTYFTHIERLQRLQNQAVRLMTFSPFYFSCSSLFSQLNILPLRQLFCHRMSIVAFRLITHDIFIACIDHRHLTNGNITRFSQCNNLLLPAVRTNYGKFSTLFTSIAIWNSLPFELKSSHNIHIFTSRSKKYYVQELTNSYNLCN